MPPPLGRAHFMVSYLDGPESLLLAQGHGILPSNASLFLIVQHLL